MTSTQNSSRRRSEDLRPFVAPSELADDLQAVLVDLVELHLQAKQAHWNVIGPGFRSMHLSLDELVDIAREASDTIAERMRALQAVPDGRSDTVTATTSLPAYPSGTRQKAETVELVTVRIAAAVDTLRGVHDRVDAADPATADLLHAIIDDLEKRAWMIAAEQSPTP